jgi:hypothetical protein
MKISKGSKIERGKSHLLDNSIDLVRSIIIKAIYRLHSIIIYHLIPHF